MTMQWDSDGTLVQPFRAKPIATQLLQEFARLHVVVLGDVMLDRYVLGSVHRISPEAPIPILKHEGRRLVAGGAANAALNVAALGATATLIGVTGEDGAGTDLRHVLTHPGLDLRLVCDPLRPTTVKTRFMGGTQQMLRLDEEDAAPIAAHVEDGVIEELRDALPRADALILSDYAKGVLGSRLLALAINEARRRGIPVIADPKNPDLSAYRGVNVLTPNLIEAGLPNGPVAHGDLEVASAARRVLAASEADAVIITRSECGVTILERDGSCLHLPTQRHAVADPSGAGDSFIAALTLMRAAGGALDQAACFASIVAGLSVLKPGTATVSIGEAKIALSSIDAALPICRKLDTAAARVKAWRGEGLRIGFTNGCFDLIHPGHVQLLRAARAGCDRLVVGLNSDASVTRLKGVARPIQDETSRAQVLEALASVDLVVLFDADTPIELITALRPDLLYKGADYALEDIVGASIVQGYGGQVERFAVDPAQSTTVLVRRCSSGERSGYWQTDKHII